MSSAFSGLSIATSGLYVNQRALDTTGHNVSNVNTSGYTRQQVMQGDTSYLKSGQYQTGTGVGIEKLRQVRSIFLDNMYRNGESSLGYWQTRENTLGDIEAIMSSLADSGSIQDAIDEFFNAWAEVSKDPASGQERASLIGYANSLLNSFDQLDSQLAQIQNNLNSQVASMVAEINSIAEQVAGLNGKIARYQTNNEQANDDTDELNSLLDTLANYVDISVSKDTSGMYRVSVGGVSLVSGTASNKLICTADSSDSALNTVYWEGNGMKLKLKDGMLLGLTELCGGLAASPIESGDSEADVDADSESCDFSGTGKNVIAELRTGLNMLINLLTRKINAIHNSGEGLDGSTGTDFFVKIDDSLPFEAGNIQVNPALDDTDKVAASSIGGADDGAIASEIADFTDTEYFQNDGLKMTARDFYSMLVEWIGTEGQEAENFTSNQATLVQQLAEKKESLSAVSLDEELTNLVKYQHAYNACARLMNIIDGMLETVIGMVGR